MAPRYLPKLLQMQRDNLAISKAKDDTAITMSHDNSLHSRSRPEGNRIDLASITTDVQVLSENPFYSPTEAHSLIRTARVTILSNRTLIRWCRQLDCANSRPRMRLQLPSSNHIVLVVDFRQILVWHGNGTTYAIRTRRTHRVTEGIRTAQRLVMTLGLSPDFVGQIAHGLSELATHENLAEQNHNDRTAHAAHRSALPRQPNSVKPFRHRFTIRGGLTCVIAATLIVIALAIHVSRDLS